jgi:hypothetical protein
MNANDRTFENCSCSAWTSINVNRAKGRHRPGDVADHEQLRLVRTPGTERRIEGHPAGGQRPTHRPPYVEPPLLAVPALHRDPRRELAGQRRDLGPQLRLVLRGQVEEIQVLDRRPRHAIGDLVDPPLRSGPPPDLRLDLLMEGAQPRLELVPVEPLLEWGELVPGLVLRAREQIAQQLLDVTARNTLYWK